MPSQCPASKIQLWDDKTDLFIFVIFPVCQAAYRPVYPVIGGGQEALHTQDSKTTFSSAFFGGKNNKFLFRLQETLCDSSKGQSLSPETEAECCFILFYNLLNIIWVFCTETQYSGVLMMHFVRLMEGEQTVITTIMCRYKHIRNVNRTCSFIFVVLRILWNHAQWKRIKSFLIFCRELKFLFLLQGHKRTSEWRRVNSDFWRKWGGYDRLNGQNDTRKRRSVRV